MVFSSLICVYVGWGVKNHTVFLSGEAKKLIQGKYHSSGTTRVVLSLDQFFGFPTQKYSVIFHTPPHIHTN